MKPLVALLCLMSAMMAQEAVGKTVTSPKNLKKPSAAKVVRAKKPSRPPAPPMARHEPPAMMPADDGRTLVPMPSPARLAMRAEMRDRMSALDTVVRLMLNDQLAEAGQIAQERLGVAVWGQHSRLPQVARPEQYMPKDMLALATDGYQAASEFATVALAGDRPTALALLPQLTGRCAQCHQTYRIR